MSMASIELDCYSRDELHTGVDGYSAVEVVECDARTLVDTIAAAYKKEKSAGVLTSLEGFKSFTLPPVMKFPILFIGIEGIIRDHKFTGRDAVYRDINIYVMHQMTNKETSLIRNVELVDLCRRILFANKHFSGYAAHFEYKGITYGQLEAASGLIYGSSLRFSLESWERLAK